METKTAENPTGPTVWCDLVCHSVKGLARPYRSVPFREGDRQIRAAELTQKANFSEKEVVQVTSKRTKMWFQFVFVKILHRVWQFRKMISASWASQEGYWKSMTHHSKLSLWYVMISKKQPPFAPQKLYIYPGEGEWLGFFSIPATVRYGYFSHRETKCLYISDMLWTKNLFIGWKISVGSKIHFSHSANLITCKTRVVRLRKISGSISEKIFRFFEKCLLMIHWYSRW